MASPSYREQYDTRGSTAKEPPKVTDPWTDKQLATLRRDCVTIAVDWYKVSEAEHDLNIVEFADLLYNYILEHKLPTKGE